MKIPWLLLVLFLVVSCTSEVKPSENPFSTPESTIIYLENEMHNTKNASLFISRTHFSDYTVSQIDTLFDVYHIDSMVPNDKEALLKQFKQMLIDKVSQDIPEDEMAEIIFTGRKDIDDIHVVLDYIIYYKYNNTGGVNEEFIKYYQKLLNYYQNATEGEELSDEEKRMLKNPSEEQKRILDLLAKKGPTWYVNHWDKEHKDFLIKIGNEWFMDAEAEFVDYGWIDSKEILGKKPPIPENIKDCGTEFHPPFNFGDKIKMNKSVRQCFYDAYQLCLPAKNTLITYRSGEDDAPITSTLWFESFDNKCLIHVYTDSKNQFTLGKFYSVCSVITFIDVPREDQTTWEYLLDECKGVDGYRSLENVDIFLY